jgi:hypothetical protein
MLADCFSNYTEVLCDSTEVLSDSTEVLFDSTEVLSDSTEVLSNFTEVLSDSIFVSKNIYTAYWNSLCFSNVWRNPDSG